MKAFAARWHATKSRWHGCGADAENGRALAGFLATLEGSSMNRNNVRGINRVVALMLATVWFCAGVGGVVLGYLHHRWLLMSIGVFALWYGVLWCRVVVRSQLLTWRELAVPWRRR